MITINHDTNVHCIIVKKLKLLETSISSEDLGPISQTSSPVQFKFDVKFVLLSSQFYEVIAENFAHDMTAVLL